MAGPPHQALVVNMTDVRDLCACAGFSPSLLRFPPWSQIRKTLGHSRGFKSSAGTERLPAVGSSSSDASGS